MSTDQATWESVVQKLYGNLFAYIATGPRRHEDWRLDVLDVMNREAPDPRGWLTLDDSIIEWEGEGGNLPELSGRLPACPFLPPTQDMLSERLYEIDRDAAAEQLIAMTAEGCMLPKALKGFAESLEELLAMAHTLLSRYGSKATFRTNVAQAYDNRHPDYSSTFRSWHAMSIYPEDIGLVAVSDTEVGLFWTFAADY